MPSGSAEDWDAQRSALIHAIEQRRPQGSANNELVLVFDGRPGPGFVVRTLSIRIVFSHDRSADDVIRSLLEQAARPRTVTVVTDDREIQSAARMVGAEVMSVKDFLSRLFSSPGARSRKPGGPARSPTEKYISKSVEFAINKEMADVWLSKKGRRSG